MLDAFNDFMLENKSINQTILNIIHVIIGVKNILPFISNSNKIKLID